MFLLRAKSQGRWYEPLQCPTMYTGMCRRKRSAFQSTRTRGFGLKGVGREITWCEFVVGLRFGLSWYFRQCTSNTRGVLTPNFGRYVPRQGEKWGAPDRIRAWKCWAPERARGARAWKCRALERARWARVWICRSPERTVGRIWLGSGRPLTPVLREIYDLRNLWLLGYLRMRQVFRRQVFRKG